MILTMMKSKIHRATVTQADLNYEGSISIDPKLLKASNLLLNERVDMIANGFARKEETRLFYGSNAKYKEFLKEMPKARNVSSSASKKGKAYSYVSVVEGVVQTHTTWAECEKRVKGKKAKFKKAFSETDEAALIAEWGR